MGKLARINKAIKARMPNWLLATVLTLGWKNGLIRNSLFSEVERRWPAVFVSTWRSTVIVKVK